MSKNLNNKNHAFWPWRTLRLGSATGQNHDAVAGHHNVLESPCYPPRDPKHWIPVRFPFLSKKKLYPNSHNNAHPFIQKGKTEMYLLKDICVVLSAVCCCYSAPVKREYVIGGWIWGNAGTFLKKWRPLFETYLTEVVGPLYNPLIAFNLVALDYTKESMYRKMIDRGLVDFVCKFQWHMQACALDFINFACPLRQHTGNLGLHWTWIWISFEALICQNALHNKVFPAGLPQ